MASVPADEYEADLVVAARDAVADDVIRLTLSDPSGAELPAWDPGAHIDLVLGPDLTRQYSLCGSPGDRSAFTVGVLREPSGRGGSQMIHDTLQAGSAVRVRGPRNHFALVPSADYVFIAGGIGITPILPMITQAEQQGATWTLLYGGRSPASMAFTDALAAYGDRVTLMPGTDIAPMAAALDERLGTPRPGTLVYACGPEGLLAAVEGRCATWPAGSLHLERFTAKAIDDAVDTEFTAVLARSGITITVPVGRSIFEAAQDNGVTVLGSCHEGICGTCETVIIEGEADHRDSVLNADEQAANETMMICVSRCRSAIITLDL